MRPNCLTAGGSSYHSTSGTKSPAAKSLSEWIDQRIVLEFHADDGLVANPNAMKHLLPGAVFGKPIPHGVKFARQAVAFDLYF
jgi:NADPH-dependent curcumin reductase CurA